MDNSKLTSFPNTIDNAFSNLLMKGNNFILRRPKLQFTSLCNNNAINNQQYRQQPETSTNVTTNETTASHISLSTSLSKPLTNNMVAINATLNNASENQFAVCGTSAKTCNATTKNSRNGDNSGMVACAVCSLPVNDRNMVQAMKYGELSCEFCRKFISKVARKALSMKHQTALISSSIKSEFIQCKGNGKLKYVNNFMEDKMKSPINVLGK